MKKALSFYLFEDTEEFLCHGDNFNHLKLAYQNNTLMSKLGIDPLVNSCKNAFVSLFFVNNYILFILKRFEVFCVNIYRIHNLQRPESKSAYVMYPFIGFVGIYKKKWHCWILSTFKRPSWYYSELFACIYTKFKTTFSLSLVMILIKKTNIVCLRLFLIDDSLEYIFL